MVEVGSTEVDNEIFEADSVWENVATVDKDPTYSGEESVCGGIVAPWSAVAVSMVAEDEGSVGGATEISMT